MLEDGPQVFRSLPVGARVQPRLMGAQPRGVFGGGGRGLDPDRPLRLPRSETGAGDVFRGAGLCRPFAPAWVRRLCRDLAERIARQEPHPAGAVDRRGPARLSGLSRPAISQPPPDPRPHHPSPRPPPCPPTAPAPPRPPP